MSNTYFQFKKFRVEQDLSGMKVCTDSCIFGAWVKENDAKTFLDIGTGTGLLTLMLAQRHKAIFDAVEIDNNASLQAQANFQKSLWKENINFFHTDIHFFEPTSSLKYDVIICNPPFFSNHLKSSDSRKNKALHDETLSLHDLLTVVGKLLNRRGKFYVMLPPDIFGVFQAIAARENLFPEKKLVVRENDLKPVFRIMASFNYDYQKTNTEELLIRDHQGHYSLQFKELLQEYYLQF